VKLPAPKARNSSAPGVGLATPGSAAIVGHALKVRYGMAQTSQGLRP
jgi:hypothetical protein